MAESYLQSFCDEEDEQKVEAPSPFMVRPRGENEWKLQALCIPSSLMVSLSPPLIINVLATMEKLKKNFFFSLRGSRQSEDETERERYFLCFLSQR